MITERDLARILQNPDITIDGVPPVPPVIRDAGIHDEHTLQAAIIRECDRRALDNAAWSMVAAIPNGQYRSGQRMEAGLRAGFPDLGVFVARRGYHAAFLELKHGKGKPSQLQWEWMDRLKAQGYWAGVVWGYDAAMTILEWYVEGGE